MSDEPKPVKVESVVIDDESFNWLRDAYEAYQRELRALLTPEAYAKLRAAEGDAVLTLLTGMAHEPDPPSTSGTHD